jgi:hypothetical protein
MTQTELRQSIENISGCKIAHIEYTTEEKTPKYLGLGNVTKYVSGEVQVNFDYENAVNNRLEKLGEARTFVAGSLPFGAWVVPNKTFEYKGEYYLRYYQMKGSVMSTEYFVDGRPATATEIATIKAWKAGKSNGSKKQAAEGLAENQVMPKGIKFSNITAFKCGEIVYRAARLAA